MEREDLEEIRAAVEDVIYMNLNKRKYNSSHTGYKNRSLIIEKSPAPTDIIKVRGSVPRGFFDWFISQSSKFQDEQKMLQRCYFVEVAE